MMRNSTVLFVFLAISVSALAQSRTELLQYGDDAFSKGQYGSAAYFYLRILNETPDKEKNVTYPYEVKPWIVSKKPKAKKDTSVSSFASAEEGDVKSGSDQPDLGYQYVVHHAAESFRLNHDYQNAEMWYGKSMENKYNQYPDDWYWYAVSLMKNEKYDLATNEFETFKNSKNRERDPYLVKRAGQQIINCQLVTDPSRTREDIIISELDSVVNTGTSNFGMIFYGNEESLLFASGRPGNTVDGKKKQDPVYISDFYATTKYSDGFGEPKSLGMPVNTAMNEGCGVLSTDRSTFYFTRWNPDIPKECAIYVSKFFNNVWMQPLKLDESVNLESHRSMHPALTEDESRLYYASDRPGGKGGMDIWYCDIDEYGGLSLPVNMSSLINTPEDEEAPFYHYYTKTLYFSSDGHETFGGLDILRTTYNEDDTLWSSPENIGKPVNSSKDDKFFVLNDNQLTGYFSSDRTECKDCDDQTGSKYCYTIYEVLQPKLEFSIKGTVFNAETDKIIPNALVTFKDVRGNMEPSFLMTDDKGQYKRDLKEGWDLFLKAQKVKFFGDAAAITTVGLKESRHFIQDFYLTPIPLGEIEIPGIEYDYDKATLRPESKKILDDLVEFLNLNDNIIVELRSHTDTRGADEYNLRLSEERAQSVVDYLIANGIERIRLLPKGYGETQTLDDCSKYEECGDTGDKDCPCHQRNRRTAFKTISEDYKDLYRNQE